MKSTGQPAAKLRREIAALKKMSDAEVNFSEIPPQDPHDRKWQNAAVGMFYGPIKQPIALRIDADVLAKGAGYQLRINEILRRQMVEETRKAIAASPSATRMQPSTL